MNKFKQLFDIFFKNNLEFNGNINDQICQIIYIIDEQVYGSQIFS